MAVLDFNEQIANGPTAGTEGAGRAKTTGRGSQRVANIQQILVNKKYPVRSKPPTDKPDGLWGPVTNDSLLKFIEDLNTTMGTTDAVLELQQLVTSDYKATYLNLDKIYGYVVTPDPATPQATDPNGEPTSNKTTPGKPTPQKGKPTNLQRIDFEVDGKKVTNFPITYLLGMMDVRSPKAVSKSTIYMIEFLKTYGLDFPSTWTDIKNSGLFSKAVGAMSKVLSEAGYVNLQSYMAPMESFIIDMAEKEKTQTGSADNIFTFLAGRYPAGHEYHKMVENPEMKKRLLSYLVGKGYSDEKGNMTAAKGVIEGQLAIIADYLKGGVFSMEQGRKPNV